MKFKLVLVGLLFLGVSSFAQKGQIRVGGGLGINFGNNSYFGFNVSPAVGYMATNNLEVGARVGYWYGNDDFFRQNMFSAGPYANYFFQNLFVRGNYEFYTGNFELKSNDQSQDINESALWLGGGYRQIVGNNAELRVGAMYNVLYNEDDSIFASGFQPFVGFSIGL